MQSKNKRWLVAALPLAMACTVSAQSKVTDVSTRQIDGAIAVHIGGSDLAQPSTKWDHGAFVLGFQASLSAKSTTLHPNSGGIKAISFGKEGHQVSVAVRPSTNKNPQIVRVSDGWLVYFEESIPSTASAYVAPQASTQKAPAQKSPLNVTPINPRDFKSKALVTLNFVDTDIVQILKALAIQANVNLAMGPDVTGKVTVNLDNVPVDEALDMVTTLGGIKYGYANNTYVVASAARYDDMMATLSHRASSETRVVPLFSREGSQVKAAILKMVSPSTAEGKYELVLPSEKMNVMQTQSLTPGAAGKDDKTGAPGASGQTDTKVAQLSANDDKKDDYVVLIGTPSRMDSVEKAVRALDEQICGALGIHVGTTQALVRVTYEPKGSSAQDLMKSLLGPGDKNEFNSVQLLATPSTSASKQAIVLSGRDADVSRVMEMLSQLDKAPGSDDSLYEIVGLKYIKPNYAKSQIVAAVPGLQALFLPPAVDPNVGQDLGESGQGASVVPGGAGGQGGGAAASGGGSSGGSSGSGSGGSSGGSSQGISASPVNTANVNTSTKSNTVPMKLILHGSREQIDQAKKYLAMVDIAPKQVAVEFRVMELSREDALKVGLDWSVLTGGTLKSIEVNQQIGDISSAGAIKGTLGWHNGGSAGIMGMLDQLTTKTNTIARPSILANDGVPTNIFVGDEVRYVVSVTPGTANSSPSVQTGEIDTGVNFNLTARVGDEGNIFLDLAPTLEILQGFTSVPNSGQLPQTSRRSAQTQVTVKSGETLAIGGLIQDQDVKTYAGIPILKDLPIIGKLFGRTNNDKVRTEVVFFVTVREVTEADRQGAANPNKAERDNKDWPGQKDNKRGGG